MKSNNIEANLTSIDISDNKNYILEFANEKKKIMLGDASDLSAKMAWISLFIKERKNENGTLHLNANEVYFSYE